MHDLKTPLQDQIPCVFLQVCTVIWKNQSDVFFVGLGGNVTADPDDAERSSAD